jgi:hypothetical protein
VIAHALPTHRSLAGRIFRTLALAFLRWSLDCQRYEQALYVETGRAGPIFERECRRQQRRLMAQIRRLEMS